MSVSWLSVSEEVQHLLEQAAEHWENSDVSEHYMEQALQKAGDDPDVLIAAYRYFFYKNNPKMALVVASKVVDRIQQQEQLPQDWEQQKTILLNRLDDPVIRLYLNAYSASGLLLSKLGEIERAKEIATQIKTIDIKNEFGASLILDILTHPVDDDDESF